MPKSKRNKQIDLSKTKKHGLEGKKKLLEEIRSCAETYTHLFIFSVNDMRNSKIKSVREQWKHSRFFIGKNKVMAKALGISSEDEFRPNLHKIGRQLKGERGLLFSNQSIEDVLKWFSSYSEGDFARSGNCATETVILQEGPLSQFPHNLEPYLRQLGLPTTLKKGIIHLVKDHTVCNVGDVLTPDTAKIVKLLGYEMAEFYIKIECVWSQDGSFSDFTREEESKENMNQTNSSFLSKQTSSDVASMDVDEVEITEPSDEMIEQIIMKNRQSLMGDKLEQLKNAASSNESSDDEDMTDFAELKTTDKEATLKKSNDLSTEKIESIVSEIKSIPGLLEKKSNEVINISNTETINKTSPAKAGSNARETGQVSESVEDSKITTDDAEIENEDEEISQSEKDDKSTPKKVGDKNGAGGEMSELVEDTKTTLSNAEDSHKDKDISETVKDTKAIPDDVESEDEDIPELVEDASSLKRLSLDKSVLLSPVILEKRPKFSPKMTRSAMKAKKTVSKTDANKIEANGQPKSSNDEVEEQPSRGRSHKRHSTESPAERKLRNRAIKIVKKKK